MSKTPDEISADAYDARCAEQKKLRDEKNAKKRMTCEEITKDALQMLAKETENFVGVLGKPKKERPIITQKMVDKAKKKLKKLQKWQRKQDKQGVIKMDLSKYKLTTVDSIVTAPVITERLDVSELPIVCDANMKPEIIKCQHLLVGSKVLENGDIMKKCLGCGIDMRSITLDGVFDALGKPCVI